MLGPDGTSGTAMRGNGGEADVPGLVVAGGEVEDLDWLRREARSVRIIVAADRGAVALVAAGVMPDVLVGDLDSVDAATVARLEAAGVLVERHPADKDATDLELAIDVAVARGVTRLRIAGALRPATTGGPRLDHLFGNLAALGGAAGRVAEARLVAPDAEVTVITGPGSCVLTGGDGDHVSLVALGDRVDGIRTTGLRWPLVDESLAWGTTRGVSNELATRDAKVEVRAGRLLVAHQRRIDSNMLDGSHRPSGSVGAS